MDTLARDLRYAVRTLQRMRGVAILAILTLALGIGATTTMFSVVYARLLRPAPFADPDRLVILFNTSVTPSDGLVRLRWSMPNVTALRSAATSFESVASFTGALLTMSGRGDPEHIEGEVVSSDYFRTLRVTPVAGRAFTGSEDALSGAEPVTLIGARLWRRKFAANPAVIGERLVVNDVPLTVVGILPDGFAGLTGKAELWIPPPMAARLTYSEYMTTRQNFISVVARLKEGVALSQSNAELAAIGSRFTGNDSATDAIWGATSVPLRDARVESTERQSALLLLAAAVCVLLIGCVNVASLLLARARVRRREIAVRLAIGSGRGRLVRQLLAEALVMAAVAGVCGTVLAWWGVSLFTYLSPPAIPSGRNNYLAIGSLGAPALDPAVLLFALAVALGTPLLCALVPALSASRLDLVTALKEDSRGGGRRGRALSILVVSEVAIACLLLTAAGVLIENFARIQGRRTGFISDDVLTFWVRPAGSRYPVASGPATVNRLLTSIQAVPGVESAAVNRCTPFSGCSRTVLFLPERPIDPATAPGVGRHYVSEDYFRSLGIPILAGRALSDADRAGGPPVAIVNESGARRFWPGESPLGKRVWFGTTTGPFSDPARPVEIVGVAGDVRYEGVDQPDRPDRACARRRRAAWREGSRARGPRRRAPTMGAMIGGGFRFAAGDRATLDSRRSRTWRCRGSCRRDRSAGTRAAAAPTPGELRRLMGIERLRPRKSLSQHFLTDPAALDAIVEAAELRPGDRVVEIGPGLGVLTRRLLAAGASVIAVELDRAWPSGFGASWVASRASSSSRPTPCRSTRATCSLASRSRWWPTSRTTSPARCCTRSSRASGRRS